MDKTILKVISEKVDLARDTSPDIRIITFSSLYSQFLSPEEAKSTKKIQDICPVDYGFSGPFYGIEGVPPHLNQLLNQKYTSNGKECFLTEYLPTHIHDLYLQLDAKIKNDLGKTLLVDSGYRSPAYQLLLFIKYLVSYDFDIRKTCTRVAFPGYSQHCLANHTAIDFVTQEGIPDVELTKDFSTTPEYKWLLENASKFHFFLSYSRENPFGVMFEPWHWQYRGPFA